MRSSRRILVLVASLCLVVATPARGLMASAGQRAGWTWPVTGPVIRGFDLPDDPYGPGHRGIDIAVAVGTTIVAPADGTVSFAGPVGGRLFLTIDHGGGLSSTYSWLTADLVKKGDVVIGGQPVALTGWGHPNTTVPHLHFGIKLDDAYVDPMDYLGPISLAAFVRLAPVP
jgi:murein DD-endopeptidase MepM/ murein hydrolase activator NlpD